MTRTTASTMQRDLARTLRRVSAGERVLVSDEGRDVAAPVSVYDLLALVALHDAAVLAFAMDRSKRIDGQRMISLDELDATINADNST